MRNGSRLTREEVSSSCDTLTTYSETPASGDHTKNATIIDDIPDLDGPGTDVPTKELSSLSVSDNAPPSHANIPDIDEIPDVDDHGISGAMGSLSVSGKEGDGDIPDMDEIPDMEDDLEEADDEATAAPKPPVVPPKTPNAG